MITFSYKALLVVAAMCNKASYNHGSNRRFSFDCKKEILSCMYQAKKEYETITEHQIVNHCITTQYRIKL